MPSGGARARSGPAPDPAAFRRERDGGEWITLPAAGREGEAPEWPLADISAREAAIWQEQWRRPQAILWERNGQELEVAMFVRSLVDAEARGATVAARTLVRQQMDSLLLTIPALRSARVRIGEPDEVAERRSQRSSASQADIRDRLKAIDGGAR